MVCLDTTLGNRDARLRQAIADVTDELCARVGAATVSARGLLAVVAAHPDLLTRLRQATIDDETCEMGYAPCP